MGTVPRRPYSRAVVPLVATAQMTSPSHWKSARARLSTRPPGRIMRAASTTTRRGAARWNSVGEDDRVGGPVGEGKGECVGEEGWSAAAGAGDVEHFGGCVQSEDTGRRRGRADGAE